MECFLRCLLLSVVTIVLLPACAYGKKPETKTGTLVYAVLGNSISHAKLYFYLNDSENSVLALSPSDSPFSGCYQTPCISAQTELLTLEQKCMHVWASPFCATTQDYPYALLNHKGKPSIEIGFRDRGWIAMPAIFSPASTLSDTFIGGVYDLDPKWEPSTASGWRQESDKLKQQFGRSKEKETDGEFECLTHLKIDASIYSLEQCGNLQPENTNSDLRGEQRIYHVTVWGNDMYVGYREVLVYVNTQKGTIENVQWDDNIHTN
jgi:hypothetical protein